MQVLHILCGPVGELFRLRAVPIQQEVGEGADAELHHPAEEVLSPDDALVGGGEPAAHGVLAMHAVAAGEFAGAQHRGAEHGTHLPGGVLQEACAGLFILEEGAPGFVQRAVKGHGAAKAVHAVLRSAVQVVIGQFLRGAEEHFLRCGFVVAGAVRLNVEVTIGTEFAGGKGNHAGFREAGDELGGAPAALRQLDIIAVNHDNPVVSGAGPAGIGSTGHPHVLRQVHHFDIMPGAVGSHGGLDDLERVIRGGIVHQHKLERAAVFLLQAGENGGLGIGGGVVAGHDQAHARLGGSGFHVVAESLPSLAFVGRKSRLFCRNAANGHMCPKV